MSVTFAPVMPESFWATRTEVIRCVSTDEIVCTMPENWRDQPIVSREWLIGLSAAHCLDCLQYEPMPETLMPEGYTELNVHNGNAARILLVTGLAKQETWGDTTCVELSGAISVAEFEAALLVADWAGNPVHRLAELSAVIESAKRLGCTEIQYA